MPHPRSEPALTEAWRQVSWQVPSRYHFNNKSKKTLGRKQHKTPLQGPNETTHIKARLVSLVPQLLYTWHCWGETIGICQGPHTRHFSNYLRKCFTFGVWHTTLESQLEDLNPVPKINQPPLKGSSGHVSREHMCTTRLSSLPFHVHTVTAWCPTSAEFWWGPRLWVWQDSKRVQVSMLQLQLSECFPFKPELASNTDKSNHILRNTTDQGTRHNLSCSCYLLA